MLNKLSRQLCAILLIAFAYIMVDTTSNNAKADSHLRECDVSIENPNADLSFCDFRGDRLLGTNFEGANLEGADLRYANLEVANFEGADLYEATLYEANLEGANLKNAILQGAWLSKANLKGANLEGASMQGARLWKANLKGANLAGASLQGAIVGGNDNDVTNFGRAKNLTKEQILSTCVYVDDGERAVNPKLPYEFPRELAWQIPDC